MKHDDIERQIRNNVPSSIGDIVDWPQMDKMQRFVFWNYKQGRITAEQALGYIQLCLEEFTKRPFDDDISVRAR